MRPHVVIAGACNKPRYVPGIICGAVVVVCRKAVGIAVGQCVQFCLMSGAASLFCRLTLRRECIHSGAVTRRCATGLVVGDKVILLMASLAKFLVDLVIHGYSSFKMRSSVTGCMLSYTVPILNSLPGA